MQEKPVFLKWQMIVIGILVFGTLIAFSEAIFGHILTLIKFPYKGGLLTGISFGIIGGIILAVFKKPYLLIGAGIFGALLRMLLIPVLKVSYTCFLNGSLGIALEAIAIGAVCFIWIKSMERKNIYSQIGAGAIGAFLSSMLFWAIGMYVEPGKYLLSFMGNPVKWLLTESFIWALFTGILMPFGYLAGTKVYERLTKIMKVKTWPVYVSSFIIIIVCFSIIAILYAVTL